MRTPPQNSRPTERFSNRVENYIRYRPTYPAEIVPFLHSQIGLHSDWQIADIGSGTGISAAMFLVAGLSVTGVEPNTEMREASERLMTHQARFRTTSGTAEATQIESNSIDLIVCAQAFHWFDLQATRHEFRRILRPNGWVVLMWNHRKTDSSPFLRGYEQFLLSFSRDYAQVDHANLTKADLDAFFGIPCGLEIFPNHQDFDFQGLLGRTASASYMPTQGDPRYPEMVQELRILFDRYQIEGQIQIRYDTEVYFSQFAAS